MTTHGFSLIEILIVIAITAVLSLLVSLNVVAFQKQAVFESTAKEFMTVLKIAQTNSINGVSLNGHNFDYFDPAYLPVFGVNTSASQYSLFIQYRINGDVYDTVDTLTTANLPNSVSVTQPAQVVFTRLSGSPSGTTVFDFSETGNPQIKRISINGKNITQNTL